MGCGYDLRGLSSERCPECGLAIEAALSGVIPWERRKELGYFRAFVRTLGMGTFRPTKLARATGEGIDLRSARIFRWIVRGLIVVPMVGLFELAVAQNGGLNAVFTIESRLPGGPFWEPRFLWTVGVTFWPVLPIGFIIAVILATGISHWLYMKRLEPVRQNRVMALSFYICLPIGLVWLPCLGCAAYAILSNPDWAIPMSDAGRLFLAACSAFVGVVSGLALLVPVLNSLRAIRAAAQCGMFRISMVGGGFIIQSVMACAIGLGLFPMVVGLFRLMITSLWR